MKTDQLIVPVDAEKLSALRMYAAKKAVSLEAELTDAVGRLYEKLVPAAVREYIENRPDISPPVRPPRPARSRGNSGDTSAGV